MNSKQKRLEAERQRLEEEKKSSQERMKALGNENDALKQQTEVDRSQKIELENELKRNRDLLISIAGQLEIKRKSFEEQQKLLEENQIEFNQIKEEKVKLEKDRKYVTSVLNRSEKLQKEVEKLNQEIATREEVLERQQKALLSALALNKLWDVDVLIICACFEEANAVKELFSNHTLCKEFENRRLNQISYWFCNIDKKNIVIAWQSARGTFETITAIMSFTSLIKSLKLLAMPGICLGLEEETKLGDVIVASEVIDLTSLFNQSIQLDGNLSIWVQSESAKLKWVQKVQMPNPDKDFVGAPKVVFGPIGSGQYKKEDLGSLIDNNQEKKMIGFDAEAFALFKARPTCLKLVVKSVANFLNEKKDGRFDQYAAHTSAAFLLHTILDFFQDHPYDSSKDSTIEVALLKKGSSDNLQSLNGLSPMIQKRSIKSLSEVNVRAQEIITSILEKEITGAGWKQFAETMQSTLRETNWIPNLYDEILNKNNPAKDLFNFWATKDSFTIDNLIIILQKMEHQELLKLINSYVQELSMRMNNNPVQ